MHFHLVIFFSRKIAVWCVNVLRQGVQSGQCFRIFEISIFCFVMVMFDPVHDVDAIFHIP